MSKKACLLRGSTASGQTWPRTSAIRRGLTPVRSGQHCGVADAAIVILPVDERPRDGRDVDGVLDRFKELTTRAAREIAALQATIAQLERLRVEIEQHGQRWNTAPASTGPAICPPPSSGPRVRRTAARHCAEIRQP
ncbi:hypothetical protein [Catellatospora sp. NPDC049609]|uniref:hypothetical protein n=1 Tax=Catellatospora sp. NPDC049609 TaxID=3155505 RepID=UPI00343432E7